MEKQSSDELIISGTKIPQWLITVLASLLAPIIVGFFTIKANTEPIRIQISATQTAESRVYTPPAINLTATAQFQNSIATQEAFATSVRATEQALISTATALASNNTVIVPTPSNVIIPVSAITDNIPAFFEKNYLFLVFWLLISLANKPQRDLVSKRASILVSKPSIFQKDTSGVKVFLYPRSLLETMSNMLNTLPTSLKKAASKLVSFAKKLSSENIYTFITSLFLLCLFVVVLWADAIAVSNTLAAAQIINSTPPFLGNYEISIIVGSLFATLIGGYITSNKDYSQNKTEPYRKTFIASGYFLIFSGIFVTLIFGAARYLTLAGQPFPYITQLNEFVIFVVIPVNNGVASFVLAADIEANTKMVLAYIGGIILYLLSILSDFIVKAFLLAVDIEFRLLIIYMYVTSFIVLTPLDLFTGLFGKSSHNALSDDS